MSMFLSRFTIVRFRRCSCGPAVAAAGYMSAQEHVFSCGHLLASRAISRGEVHRAVVNSLCAEGTQRTRWEHRPDFLLCP
jgi:hypothetical protein